MHTKRQPTSQVKTKKYVKLVTEFSVSPLHILSTESYVASAFSLCLFRFYQHNFVLQFDHFHPDAVSIWDCNSSHDRLWRWCMQPAVDRWTVLSGRRHRHPKRKERKNPISRCYIKIRTDWKRKWSKLYKYRLYKYIGVIFPTKWCSIWNNVGKLTYSETKIIEASFVVSYRLQKTSHLLPWVLHIL